MKIHQDGKLVQAYKWNSSNFARGCRNIAPTLGKMIPKPFNTCSSGEELKSPIGRSILGTSTLLLIII
jgi:hypothetical protein